MRSPSYPASLACTRLLIAPKQLALDRLCPPISPSLCTPCCSCLCAYWLVASCALGLRTCALYKLCLRVTTKPCPHTTCYRACTRPTPSPTRTRVATENDASTRLAWNMLDCFQDQHRAVLSPSPVDTTELTLHYAVTHKAPRPAG